MRRKILKRNEMHHGTPTHPNKIIRSGGIKPQKDAAYLEASVEDRLKGKYGKQVPGAFASHDKRHAASFAALGKNKKGHILTSDYGKNKWETSSYKPIEDSQFTRSRIKPTRVTQVRTNSKGKHRFGHSWDAKSGSLPKHTSSQQHRTSLARNAKVGIRTKRPTRTKVMGRVGSRA